MKKILVSFLIIFVLSALYFAFFKKKEDNSPNLVFWSIQLKPFYEKQMNEIIAEFEKKHPEIKVKWMDIPIKEVQKRTLASILSSTPADLINLNPDYSILLAQKNTLEYFDDKDLSQFHPELTEKLKYNGKIYALPYYATSAVTIYNKENSEKCFKNKKFIKTYDELFALTDELTKCTGTSAFAASLNEGETTIKILNKYGVNSFASKNEILITSHIFKNLNKMYKNNELPADTMSLSHREILEKYMSGSTSVIVAGANFLSTIKKSAPDIYKKSQIANQLTGTTGGYDISLMNLIIPKRARHKDLAFEFALLLTNKENQLEFAKISNVLPANKFALEDDYFKNCTDDLYDKSRCISAQQLDNLNKITISEKNKKQITELVNKTLEEILLDKNITDEEIEKKVGLMTSKIREYN